MTESLEFRHGGSASGTTDSSSNFTPLMNQYLSIKRKQPDALLLFRMGDFYETFFDDAKKASKILGLTLTTRDKKKKNPVPLAGFPYHALNNYLRKLIDNGVKVAICEQVEDPKLAKKLVKRKIVEVITPDKLLDEIVRIHPTEILIPEGTELKLEQDIKIFYSPTFTKYELWRYDFTEAEDILKRHFAVLSLDGFGLAGRDNTICASAAILSY